MRQKGFAPILILLILTGAGLLFYFGFFYKSPSEPPPQEITTPIPTKTPITTPSPLSSWDIYKNDKYGFQIKYNPASQPNVSLGSGETGESSYLLLIKFGTNPLKSPYGFELKINNPTTLEKYRLELVGNTTDKIESEKGIVVNGISWTKMDYKIFLTTDYVPVTTAVSDNSKYSFSVTASASDIDLILSSFNFVE